MHTMTYRVLTAAAATWPVIGLTVIGTASLPLWAREMGYSAAKDLAAADRWKPCNCNFPLLPLLFLPLQRWHDHLWFEGISWLSGSWNLVNRQHVISRNTWLSMRKWALYSSPSLYRYTYICTREQRFAASPLPWGKVGFEVSILKGGETTRAQTQAW